MNGRTLTMLGISGLLGLLAAWYASVWMSTGSPQTQTAQVEKETVPMGVVLVATEEIGFGGLLSGDVVKTVELPLKDIPEGVLTNFEALNGKAALRSILPGEMIMAARLGDISAGSLLAARVEPGKRAVSVRVNDVSGVAGFVLPGDRVDVLSVRASQNASRQRQVAERVLVDVKVLAVGQKAITESGVPEVVRTVTLQVSPDGSETLLLASHEGSLQLTLRNPGEQGVIAEGNSRLQIIRGTQQEVARIKPASSSTASTARLAVIDK